MNITLTDDKYTFRKARKPHQCDNGTTAGRCDHVIQPGERYVEGCDIVRHPFGRGRYCEACAVQRGMAEPITTQMLVTRGDGMWGIVSTLDGYVRLTK